ncbi:MAG: response regulator [Roseiflexaceae bacterium]|nr:response regulator [Roseiflexaceae bacterium]
MQRILVIEADNDIRTMLVHILQRQQYRVYSAANGVQGVQMIQDVQPDLIVMELEAPLLSGWQIMQQVKPSFDLRAIPTIALTIYSHPSYQLRAYVAGFDEVLVKPFELRQLLDSVNVLLRHRSEALSPDSRVAPC